LGAIEEATPLLRFEKEEEEEEVGALVGRAFSSSDTHSRSLVAISFGDGKMTNVFGLKKKKSGF
jgi:hypothetical protein